MILASSRSRMAINRAGNLALIANRADNSISVLSIQGKQVRLIDTVMIGDTSYDMEMARAAGVLAIGVSWGYHAPDLLHGGGAHHVVETFDSLQRLLGGSPVAPDFAAI